MISEQRRYGHWAVAVACVCVGCSGPPATDSVTPLVQTTLEMLERRSRQQPPLAGVHSLRVEGGGDAALVSMDTMHAPLHKLLPTLFQRAGVSYIFERLEPAGCVTLHCMDLPLRECAEELCRSAGYTLRVERRGGRDLWVVREGPARRVPASSLEVAATLDLYHTTSAGVVQDGLGLTLPGGARPAGLEARLATFGPSRVGLVGREDQVDVVQSLLRASDTSPPKIWIELLLFRRRDVANDSVEPFLGGSLGSLLDLRLPNNALSPVFLDALQAGTASFDWSAVARQPLEVTASVFRWLVATGRLQDTRYLQNVVQSGQTASLSAGRVGYFLTTSYSGGFSFNTARPVDAMTRLQIRPVLLPSGQVEVTVESSARRFLEDDFNLTGLQSVTQMNNVLQIEPGTPVMLSGVAFSDAEERVAGWRGSSNTPLRPLTNGVEHLRSQLSVQALLIVHLQEPIQTFLSMPVVNHPIDEQ